MRTRWVALVVATYACGVGADPNARAPNAPSSRAAWGVRPGENTASGASRASSPRLPSAASAASSAEVDALGMSPRYDEIVQKSSHNSYARAEPLLDQLVYHRVRSLELDVHVMREGASIAAGDWAVYHQDLPLMRDTSCALLSDCLRQLRAFHAAIPAHEVVTLFVDLKDGFGRGHAPADLDRVIEAELGRENIATPADLVDACPGATSLRDAVAGACRFPTIRSLTGKFILAVTGGASCDPDSHVARYAGDRPLDRLAFLAPRVDGACPVAAYDARPDVAFFNMRFDQRARARDVRRRGLVARVFAQRGDLGTAADFNDARIGGANHIATDCVNGEHDPWSRTHGLHGFPFGIAAHDEARPLDPFLTTVMAPPSQMPIAEVAPIVGVRVRSGDTWGSADSLFGAFDEDARADETWSALASVPSSHVEPFAKACLVARASAEPSAPNVAVCRTFDSHPIRVQIRKVAGGPTTAVDASPLDNLTDETAAFLRLAVEASAGGGTRVIASSSVDGVTWTPIATTSVGVPLPVRGIGVSSHGERAVKALFVDLRRDGAPVSIAGMTAHAIGGASGRAFDGVEPDPHEDDSPTSH